eukprot:GHVL01033112.1.p1 GENE.GHVL01033112.1~~GHVL01033112.1.p1  ORF type:complete len:102 (-),score=7.59 GHVL01033112.1:13-318(-)
MIPVNNLYKTIIKQLPPIKHLISYGSGVYQQSHSKKENEVLDLLFVVENEYDFHYHNANTSHYPIYLRPMHKHIIEILQNSGAGVFFLPFVPFDGVAVFLN